MPAEPPSPRVAAVPSLTSRIGFRLMTLTMVLSRRGPALEARVRRAGVGPGQVVLDYACGPGYYAVPAARLVGPAGHVYALDLQPAAAAMAAGRARAAGLANVSTIVSDRDTGLPDASVDVVLLFDAIAGIVDRRGVLGELARVLKPAGHLAVWVEHGPPEATLPLVTEASAFRLRARDGDIGLFDPPAIAGP